jgi:hypothetical protein
MLADSFRHVERHFSFASIHSSHSCRTETGCVGECRAAPPTGGVQTQRSAAKTQQPRSIILDRPIHGLAGLEIRLDIRAAGNGDVLASRTVQTVLAELIPTETHWPTKNAFRDQETHPWRPPIPTWGAPRIHGELKKLGFTISERTVSRWMPKKTGKPSQTWMTFLRNHVGQMVSLANSCSRGNWRLI